MFNRIFGDSLSQWVTIGAALFVIFLLLVFFSYVIRRLMTRRRVRSVAGARNRQPRLGVVDVFDLDGQRQLLLVRRDNTEHLVMIGGPNDVVVESGIIRSARAAALSDGVVERVEPDAAPRLAEAPPAAPPRPAETQRPPAPPPPLIPPPRPVQPPSTLPPAAPATVRPVLAPVSPPPARPPAAATQVPALTPAAAPPPAAAAPPQPASKPAPLPPVAPAASSAASDAASMSKQIEDVLKRPPMPARTVLPPASLPAAEPAARAPAPPAAPPPPVEMAAAKSTPALDMVTLEEEMARLLGRGPKT